MSRGSGALDRALLARPRGRWLRHLLLASSLVVVVLSIVGMHQLSLGHEVATWPTASAAHSESADNVPPRGEVLGSCLLALTLLVLGWLLAAPRLTHVPPFLLPRRAPAVVRSTAVRRVPSLSLAELSLLRT